MEKPSDILNSTRENRLNIFFEKLKLNKDKFRDLKIANTLCKVPRQDTIPNRRYHRSRIKLPISYGSNNIYRIRSNGVIYDLYKNDNNYYFIETFGYDRISEKVLVEFKSTIQFSYVFYLFYSLLEELTEKGVSIDLTDLVYSNLTRKFHTIGGELKLTLSPFSIKNKEMSDSHLYLSIFN